MNEAMIPPLIALGLQVGHLTLPVFRFPITKKEIKTGVHSLGWQPKRQRTSYHPIYNCRLTEFLSWMGF